MADVEDADNPGRGVVLVYHAVVTNPDSVDALSPDQFPAADRRRVAHRPFDPGDDARNLLAVYPAQITLGRALPLNAAGGHRPSASS